MESKKNPFVPRTSPETFVPIFYWDICIRIGNPEWVLLEELTILPKGVCQKLHKMKFMIPFWITELSCWDSPSLEGSRFLGELQRLLRWLNGKPGNNIIFLELRPQELACPSWVSDRHPDSVRFVLGQQIGKVHTELWIAWRGHGKKKEQHCFLKQNNING